MRCRSFLFQHSLQMLQAHPISVQAPHASGTAEVALQILGALAALTTLTALRITCTGGQLPT